jgi:hypothetical protein
MTALRAAQARLLVGPLWRARAWWLIPTVAGSVLAVTALLRAVGADVEPAVPPAVGAFLMASTVGFSLDDASAAVVAPVPAPPAFRAGLRVAGALALVACCWAALLGYVASFAGPVPIAFPTLLLALFVSVGLLASTFWGGTSSAVAVLGFLALAGRVPERWTFLHAVPGATPRLLAVLAAIAGTLAVRCARDRTGY